DISLANAAASLVIAGKVETIRDGMKLATHSLDSSATALALDKLIAVSNDID
ncbi:anthranilate phosphoribosyltransferase, partial [Rhizobium ruizarguesonis]